MNAAISPDTLDNAIPVETDFWYIVLTEPGREFTAIYRLHEQGRELFVPMIRRRIPTGRTGKNGHKITRIRPRPMFPGYGFIRQAGITDVNEVLDVRGVRQLLRDQGRPVTLPQAAIQTIFKMQSQIHYEFCQEPRSRRKTPWKPGDKVRVQAEGSLYDGYFGEVQKLKGADRVELLLGAARLKFDLSADMVVAAV